MEMLFISALMFNSNTTRPSLVKLSKLGFLLYKRLLPLTTVENIGWVGEERNGTVHWAQTTNFTKITMKNYRIFAVKVSNV
jgi:hypothetical protein